MSIRKNPHVDIHKYGMIIALTIITILFGAITKGSIFNAMNISNLILQNSYLIILSVGMFFCILTGNIDLSVGSVLAFCGALLGVLVVKNGMNPWLSILIILGIGGVIGLFQGSFIAFLNIPPFIATLAGELIFRGLSLYILAGHSISPFPKDFQFIASGYLFEQVRIGPYNLGVILLISFALIVMFIREFMTQRQRKRYDLTVEPFYTLVAKYAFIALIFGFIAFKLATYRGIPLLLLVLIVIVLIYNFIASKTILGRHVYAVGGNRTAAALSGVKTKKIMLLVYVNSALLAALSGVIVTARLNAAATSAGLGFELDAIAACYIGGCAASGGEGTIGGVIIGALVMGVINNGMSIMGIGSDIQRVVKGFILLIAVTYDILSKSKSSIRV